MPELHSTLPRTSDVVLDIGGDIGALILYTGAGRNGDEIELSRTEPGAPRFHNQVHERRYQGQVVFAAVYPEIVSGEYHVWGESRPVETVTIRGGQVAEIDWR